MKGFLPKANFLSFTMVCLGLVLTAALLNSQGTSDKDFFFQWGENFLEFGARDGYESSKDYPPLTMVIMGMAFVFLPDSLGNEINVLRALNVGALLASALILGFRSRGLRAPTLFWGFAVVGALGMLGIDVWFAPPLLLALILLEKGHLSGAVALFSLATLVKWQPMVLAPFLLIYAWKSLEGTPRKKAQGFVMRVVLPSATIYTGAAILFGFENMARAFAGNLTSWVLSGNATNFNWILTWALRVTNPEQFGPIEGGLVTYLALEADWMGLGRFIFWPIFFGLLLVLSRRPADYSRTIQFSAVGFFAYFTFNVGVHSNHLFLVALLLLLQHAQSLSHSSNFVVVATLHNANLILFYGFDGSYNLQRVVAGLDLSIVLAAIHVFAFFWMASPLIRGELGRNVAKRPPPTDL